MNKRELYFIQQAGVLMQMPMSHNRTLGTTFDDVASHSFHTAIIAYVIARMEKLSHKDALVSLSMGVFHDLLEARTGDRDFIEKNYTSANEKKAIKDQFEGLNFGKDLSNLIDEYEERESLIAKCAKDADSVQQMYQEWVLMWQGNKLAEKWFRVKQKLIVPRLRTDSARELVSSMKESNPHEWWWSEFFDKNYNSDNLAGAK